MLINSVPTNDDDGDGDGECCECYGNSTVPPVAPAAVVALILLLFFSILFRNSPPNTPHRCVHYINSDLKYCVQYQLLIDMKRSARTHTHTEHKLE